MKRRKFMKLMACGSAVLPLAAAGVSEMESVTILHTNDTHSRIDPFPEAHKKFGGKGGVARRAALIKAIREETQHVLLLDAGDIFQGTPYFNMFSGELEMKLMSQMGYDLATMGNHDFDLGLEGFEKARMHANFPFVCSNYDFDDTPLIDSTQDFQIFYKGEIKVGVFGLGIELDGLVNKKLYQNTRYLDPISTAQEQADFLKNEAGCNLVVCLSHLGYFGRLNDMSDTVLAAETSNIDLIIGGHTHTFFKEPEMHKNKVGKSVLINQVGWAGLVLGRLDFYFNKKGNPDRWAARPLPTYYDIA